MILPSIVRALSYNTRIYCINRPFHSQRVARMSTTSRTPVVPRPSASLILVNDKNEILLVQRNPKQVFGGVHVFPGGNLDAGDSHHFQSAALRETFEETGLLLTKPSRKGPISADTLAQARTAIRLRKLHFNDFLCDNELELDTSSLLPFTEWITPSHAARRFHAKFYVTYLPSTSGFTSGNKQDFIPTPDGGQEVITARFLHPEDALAECASGKIQFMPPQFYILTTLSSILRERQLSGVHKSQIERLSRGAFGRMVINPRSEPTKDSEGRTILTYEGDELRGGSPGRLHRCLVRTDSGGVVTTEVTLLRNFDIFEEIEEEAFALPKL